MDLLTENTTTTQVNSISGSRERSRQRRGVEPLIVEPTPAEPKTKHAKGKAPMTSSEKKDLKNKCRLTTSTRKQDRKEKHENRDILRWDS